MHFSVEPKFVVNLARDMVLSADWRAALNMLMDDMEGMTLDIAVALLKGERTLVDGPDGMSDAPESPEDPKLQQYLWTAKWQTAGTLHFNGEFYQPYAYVVSYGREDEAYASEFVEDWSASPLALDEYRILRTKFHMHNRESDLVFFDLAANPVLFKRVQGPAFWVETFKEPKRALDAFLKERSLSRHGQTPRPDDGSFDPKRFEFYERALRRGQVFATQTDDVLNSADLKLLVRLDGMVNEIQEAKADREKANTADTIRAADRRQDTAEEAYEMEVLRTKIARQAEVRGGYLDLLVQEDGNDRFVKVPAAPFLRWASRNLNADSLEALPEWKPVSPVGLKMGGDNPLHTDWLVAAGLSPRQAYDNDHPVNKAAWRFAMGLARKEGHDCVRLAGEGVVFGRVVFPKPNEAVPEGSIAVVPFAGVDYEIAMLSACKKGRGAVVAAVGGKLAHLATVGRETSSRVAVVDDAMSTFREGQFVTINLDRLTVTRHETFLSTLDPLDR